VIGTATYLHFLDRELGQSVGAIPTPGVIESALKMLTLGTAGGMYAGLSLAWEHPSVSEDVRWLIAELIKGSLLDLVSHHPAVDEFLFSRQQLYAHDRERYPAYFRDAEPVFTPTLYKADGTTNALAAELEQIVGGQDVALPAPALLGIEQALSRRSEEAITFAFFAPFLSAESSVTAGAVRRLISSLYTGHYIAFDRGAIATGIQGLDYFESFATDFPSRDIPTLAFVLRHLGLGSLIREPAPRHRGFWEWVIHDDDSRLLLAEPVAALVELAATAGSTSSQPSPSSRRIIRAQLHRWIGEHTVEPGPPRHRFHDAFRDAVARVERVLSAVRAAHPELSSTGAVREGRTLVVTATDTEHEHLLEAVRAAGRTPQARLAGDVSYIDLGHYHRGSVVYVRCRAGSGTRGGSEDVLSVALPELRPTRVIMIGIAFGVDPPKQPIGTVLVSDHVVNYEFVRHGTKPDSSPDIVDRGEPGPADRSLVEAFRDLGMHHALPTHSGLLLSGPELIDNESRRKALVARHPSAIGGEMEGYGVYVASHRRRTPWVLVKAVCDWADGKKGHEKQARQQLAAREAAARLLAYLDA
jgi:nucleoside phosphorylase